MIQEHEDQALAWLTMTEEDLIRCSGSLEESPHLHPDGEMDPGADMFDPNRRLPTEEELVRLRVAADDQARVWVGDEYVTQWIRENR